MTWDTFFETLKKGAVASVYLFTGTEEYTKESALAALEKALLPEGMEMLGKSAFENAPAQSVIDAAETMPFLCDRRLVVVKDFAPLLSGKSRDESAETEKMLEWLKNPPETCCTVFYVRGEADGRKKLTAALNRMGAVVRFDPLDDTHIGKWARGKLKPFGKTMDAQAIAQLVFMAGRSLNTLDAEMEKLVSFTGEKESITVQDVERLVTPQTEYTVFQMIDALMQGDSLTAHRLLRSSVERGESCVGIIAMLSRQMRMLSHIAAMKQEGARLGQIEKRLELSHFVASRAEKQADRFTAESARKGYEACVDADYRVKTGRARDDQALSALMLLLPTFQRAQEDVPW